MKLNLLTEIVMKYRHTYILLQVNSSAPKRVFYISDFNYDQDEGETIPRLTTNLNLKARGNFVENGQYTEEINIKLNDYIIDLSTPEDGYRNSKGGALYYSVEPNKQYKRSICDNRLSLIGRGIGLQSNVKDYLFTSKHMSVEEAVEKILSTGFKAASISQHYAVGRYLTSRAVFVLYKDTAIGVINNDDEGEYYAVLPLERKYLEEDLEQYIRCEVRE